VFLLGHWKNYEELESSLCLEELIAILDAIRKKEDRGRKFSAALQGIDLEDSVQEKQNHREVNDVTNLKGFQAAEAGFGIGLGLGYAEIGV
jgi:hypothetical protein